MMRWRKLGIIYRPDGSLIWAKTHGMVPTPFLLTKDIIRIYVTFCDLHGIGRPGFVDIAAHDPTNVIRVSQQPILELGKPGTFDENGIVACSVTYSQDGRIYMYYVGFELGTKIRYRLLTGLAVSENGGDTFTRISPTPVLERTAAELYFRGGPYCIFDSQSYRLWYVAGSKWITIDEKPMPVYDIRYAESTDGVTWPDRGEVILPITQPDEHGFGRPAILRKLGGGYRMFYSIRRRSLGAYRLGYAESSDGRSWTRMDHKLNLDVSPGAFDSDAIMYAAPIEVGGKLYLFYNGNEFGKYGFAAAVLEVE